MRYMNNLFMLLIVMTVGQQSWAEGDVVCPDFAKTLMNYGIAQDNAFKEQYAISLSNMLLSEQRQAEAALAGFPKPTTDEQKDAKDLIELKVRYIGAASRLLQTALDESKSQAERSNSYFQALRARYSVCGAENENRKLPFGEKLGMMGGRKKRMVWNISQNLNGTVQPQSEALGLTDVNGRILDRHELAGMSIEEVSLLDITDDHLMWHTQSHMERLKKSGLDPWADLEAQANQAVSEKLNVKYDVNLARRVLEFDAIKSSGTSPKINATDIHKIKWKLKWGGEVQTEPVANRLYVRLGGKYNDLVYSNRASEEDLVLILNESNQGCEKIATVTNLKTCLLQSKEYKFNVAPFILKSGVINEDNKDILLKALRPDQRSQFLNREYVVFKESSVEFSGKRFVDRGGPSAFSTVGTTEDRVSRALSLFNEWIRNYDAKDENNKAYLMNVSGDVVYGETQHDIGGSFAEKSLILGKPGSVNALDIGDAFLSFDRKGLVTEQQVLYRPYSWDYATASDLMWMARKIVSLTEGEIRSDIQTSQWPAFMVEAWTYKMVERRNQIAQIFGLTYLLDKGTTQAPTIEFDLTTRADREKASAATGISLSQLEFYLVQLKLLNGNQLSGRLNKPYIDTVVVNGFVQSCGSSIIVGILEYDQHPSGIEARVPRNKDNKETRLCLPKRI